MIRASSSPRVPVTGPDWHDDLGLRLDLSVHRIMQPAPLVQRVSTLELFFVWVRALALLLGIVSIAAAVEEVAHHPSDVLSLGLAVTLAAGGALYLGGQAGFRLVLAIGTPVPRLLAAAVCLVTIPLGTAVAATAQLGALLAIFLALFAIESLRVRSLTRD